MMRVETPTLDWEEFFPNWQFGQGEHVTLLGPTGSGKTTLAYELLKRRKYVIAFGTKRKDPSLERLTKEGFVIKRNWPIEQRYPKAILWPFLREASDIKTQRRIFGTCLQDAYRMGGFCIYLDEIRYITDYLKLNSLCELLWQQGRSINITIIGGTQRPAFIPLVAYDQATHLFIFKNSDRRNLQRLGELGAFDSRIVQEETNALGEHEVLYLNTRKGEMVKTKVVM